MLLHLTAHTPLGIFEGYLNKNQDALQADLEAYRDKLEVHDINYVVLYSQNPATRQPTETVLRAPVLANSVLIFEIRDAA